MSFNPNNPHYTRSQAKGVANLVGVDFAQMNMTTYGLPQRMNGITPEESRALAAFVDTLPSSQQHSGSGASNTITVITMPDGKRYGGNFPVFTSYAKKSGK